MRIRKNAKISPLVHAASFLKPGTVIQTHDCQLNQSPWDVMDFSPPSSPPQTRPTAQVDENNVYAGNVSSSDCIPAVRSEYDIGDKGEYYDIATTTDKAERPRNVEDEPRCAKTDGKSWKCRRAAAKGNALCEHHLSMVRSYSSSSSPVITKRSEKKAVESQHRGRPKKARASSPADPYQFYYYSGFGPRWGKNRSTNSKGSGSDMNKNEDSSESDEDADYEDDHEIGEHMKKKARKPIKERSLKSLM